MAKKSTSFKTINLFEVNLFAAIIHNVFSKKTRYNNNKQVIVPMLSDDCRVCFIM